MVLVLKKGADERDIEAIEKKVMQESPAGFDARKYNGTLKMDGDALEMQNQLRDEWERDLVSINIG